jgi:GNAT superfamily N-acetyltransferase
MARSTGGGMTIQIRGLEPKDALDFVEFFEHMDFAHAEHWQGCYCQYYHLASSNEKWMMIRGEKAREMALINVARGYTRGYLAWDGERIMGWCHANHQAKLLRLKTFLEPYLPEGRTAVVACFMVHPAYRHQGVAARLLKAAVEGSRAEGYAAVVGLPSAPNAVPERQYHGNRELYLKAGFKKIAEADGQEIFLLEYPPVDAE